MGDVARKRIAEARELYRSGEYAEAASRLERMAPVARERGMPRVATHLSLRVAACHAQLGDEGAFDTWVQHAIDAAREDGDSDRSARGFGKLVAVVQGSPLSGRADDVVQAVKAKVGVTPREPKEREGGVNRSMRRHLPPMCASCGAPVDPDTVSFNDDGSVDCDTCGALVHG